MAGNSASGLPANRQAQPALLRWAASAARSATRAGTAVIGLVLGTVGVYGVVSYGVARRRAEFGIRMEYFRPGMLALREE